MGISAHGVHRRLQYGHWNGEYDDEAMDSGVPIFKQTHMLLVGPAN